MAECGGKMKRANWSTESLSLAMDTVRNKELSLRAAARQHGIPVTTLKGRLDGINKYAKESVKHFGRPQMLPPAIEDELVQHVLEREGMFFGLTRKSLMDLAYEVATRNGLLHSFNQEKKSAGKKWLKLFLQRHKEISLRVAEATSLARASGFNKHSISKFFDLLEKEIDKENKSREENNTNAFSGMSIFNMDETAVSTVQKKCQKVLGRKGKHQIGSISSGERGTNTTVVCCCNAAGQFVPPMILFKRKRMAAELKDGAPAGSIISNNDTGWMDKDMFIVWLNHFVAAVKPSTTEKVLLILDGHGSHTRSLEAINLARTHGIIMISLPPHTTHRLQPLDVAFFKPLQTFYGQEQERWLRANPGRQITAFQICVIFNSAYIRADSTATAVNGFAKTGIWPTSRHVFSEADFAASSFFDGQSSEQQSSVAPLQSRPTSEIENPTLHLERQAAASSRDAAFCGLGEENTACSSGAQLPASTPDPDVPVSVSYPDVSRPLPDTNMSASISSGNIHDPTSAQSNLHEELGDIALALPGKQVICSNPDGRCFFRSIVVSNDRNLQSAGRDANGLPLDPVLKLQEQFKADMLRAKMAQHMFDNLEEFRQYEPALNVDMPSSTGPIFHSIEERICLMSSATAPVGEIEIAATARVLKQPIHVVSSADGHVVKYCEVNFPAASPVTVLYTSFGDNTGHYDCLVSSAVSVSMISPLHFTPQVKKRQAKKTEAQVLTSSPYKEKLMASQKKPSNQKKPTKPAHPDLLKPTKRAANKTAKKALRMQDDAWFCFLCGNCSKEDMIQCSSCQRWVHDECADILEEQTSYQCDMCQNK